MIQGGGPRRLTWGLSNHCGDLLQLKLSGPILHPLRPPPQQVPCSLKAQQRRPKFDKQPARACLGLALLPGLSWVRFQRHAGEGKEPFRKILETAALSRC